MKRKLIHYVASFIHNSGIPVLTPQLQHNFSHKTLILLVATFNYFLAIPFAGIYTIKNRNDFYKFINPIPYLAIVSITLGTFFSIFHHKRKLGDLFCQMDNDMYTYPDEDQLRVAYDKWYLQEDKIIFVLKIIQSSYFGGIFVRSFPTFVHLFDSGSTETFLFPAWMPWPMEGQRWQFFTLFFQLCQGLCGIWCFNLVILSIITPVFEFSRQYKRLEAAVGSLWRRTEMASEGNKRKIERVMRENLIHCIKHHQILNKNFQSYRSWMEMILSCNLFICMLSLALGLYIVVNTSGFLKVYNYFEIIGVTVMNLFALCIFSEIFHSFNEGLACALFWEVDWYEMSEKNRRLLLIFHQMNKRAFQIWSFKIFPANRDTFKKIMRATYSIFNVLTALVKK